MQTLPLDSYAAIIWDCDGVLIDSEILACSPVVDILAEKGAEITLEDYLHRFMGKSAVQMMTELGISGSFPLDELKTRQKKAFTQHLKAIPGVHDVLDLLTVPVAIASGSEKERLKLTLSLTGLRDYFGDHVYSASLVKNGKPAPDIFLLAAEKLGIAPKDCLVIEDSPHGIKGAKAADMDVYAFIGGSHMTPAIRQSLIDAEPHAIFSDMNQLIIRKAA